jgi:hypothetical protein
MLNATAFVIYSVLATGGWQISDGIDEWHLMMQVMFTIALSMSIFFCVLRATDRFGESQSGHSDAGDWGASQIKGARSYQNGTIKNLMRAFAPRSILMHASVGEANGQQDNPARRRRSEPAVHRSMFGRRHGL